jgi:hypothetical protein
MIDFVDISSTLSFSVTAFDESNGSLVCNPYKITHAFANVTLRCVISIIYYKKNKKHKYIIRVMVYFFHINYYNNVED